MRITELLTEGDGSVTSNAPEGAALDIAAQTTSADVLKTRTEVRSVAALSNIGTDSSFQDSGEVGHLKSAEHPEPIESLATTPPVGVPSTLPTEHEPVEAPPKAKDHALNKFILLKRSRMLPDVLATLSYRCYYRPSMEEAEVMNQRVVDRLDSIFQQLHDVDLIEKETALRKYSDVITRFDKFLCQHGTYDFVTRAMLCLQVADDVLQFHEDIDQVESALGLQHSSILTETTEGDQQQLLKHSEISVITINRSVTTYQMTAHDLMQSHSYAMSWLTAKEATQVLSTSIGRLLKLLKRNLQAPVQILQMSSSLIGLCRLTK